MPFAAVGPRDLHYELTGDGPPLVLVMGLGVGGEAWRPLLPLFEGYRTLTYDNAGVGLTRDRVTGAPPEPPYATEGFADDLAGLLRTLELGPAHVVGVSMGGAIAMHLAAREPSLVRTLTLCATWPKADGLLRQVFAFREDLLERLAPVAERLKCSNELAAVADIPRQGASYQRQRQVAERSGGDLVAVVDSVVRELELTRHGLHYLEVDPMFHASDGETPWFVHRDPDRTARELEAIFPGQGEAYRKFLDDWTPFARSVADLVVFLDGGRVVESGPPEQVLVDPVHERTRRFLARVVDAGRL